MLFKVVADVGSCSICSNSGDKRECGRVTNFNWNKISFDEDMRCVVEDSVAEYTENRIHPVDINRVCDSCRLVVCRGVSVSSNTVVAAAPFDYSKSRKAVHRCINWVRNRPPRKGDPHSGDPKRYVVFLAEVFQKYRQFVVATGEEEFSFKQARDLRKYLQPPLASMEIYLKRTDSNRVGYYFCTTETFKRLAKEVAGTKKDLFHLTISEEERALDELERLLKSKASEIESFSWNIRDYIRAMQ